MAKQHSDSANKTKRATDPFANITVFASAGSGKTYLLVHRILKLLLIGVAPAHILAITFTRKAAAEMLSRLMNVLAEWAAASDSQLKSILQALSHPYDDTSIAKARKLYEELLFSEQEIRITTFHAFCQDILKRFAIHAGVPAGFRVVESTDDLKREARKQLFKQAQSEDDGKLSQALFKLLQHCNSVHNVHLILDTFINSRSDWLSFTEQKNDPVIYAEQQLDSILFSRKFDEESFVTDIIPMIRESYDLLSAHQTKTFQEYCEKLTVFLENTELNKYKFETIFPVYFKSTMDRREIKPSKALEKSLGAKNMQQLLSINNVICEQLEEYIDYHKKQTLFAFNQAWYYAGFRLIEIYQEIKFKQHCLDFDDLEWYTYLLLNQHESATWVQYKLDQRIQHILIDEFQDTNPTQWKLISPLLNELATGSHDNHRSLFLVGDAKQSIYGFRRANSELQRKAAEWAKEYLNADLLETDDSYRSSPAIINFVNQVFSQQDIELSKFNPHFAIQSELWGEVEVLPLITPEMLNCETSQEQYFRNPMLEAAINIENDCHYLESQKIADKISTLMNDGTRVAIDSGPRALQYSDIMILARSRTHLAPLEAALREQNIPLSSTYDKEFLNSLEVQDVLALLTYLTQSHNDLALAQVLRSPLYGMSNDDLMQISIQKETTWHEKLESYAQTSKADRAKQAFEQLQHWRNLTNTLPVHDLLDQIYFQTNILQRYVASISSDNNLRDDYAIEVQENLISLLQLSLDIDAGRYSSVQSFLNALEKPNASSILASSLQKSNYDAVRIMTIHSAKGLESPVVFLVDSGPQKAKTRAYQTVINWPSHADRPEQFFILGKKRDVDRDTHKIIELQENKEQIEELNLLYVALTRAKQFLYISGSASQNYDKYSWHSIITNSLDDKCKHEIWKSSFGAQPEIDALTIPPKHTHSFKDIDLSKPYAAEDDRSSKTQIQTQDDVLANYGTIVHKIFEIIKPEQRKNHQELMNAVEQSLHVNIRKDDFKR
ncbi:MAG: UvrD-helicase domain-containing protein, partial [Pseudomonadota bacterium]